MAGGLLGENGMPVRPPLTISAIVQSHKRREFLPMALESLLCQAPRMPEEVILLTPVDRPDVSQAYAERFRSRGVAFHTLTVGWTTVGDALARGILRATGEVIAPLDDDDRWEPAKIQRVSRSFAEDSELTLLHNGATLVDASDLPIGRCNPHRYARHRSTLLPEGIEAAFHPGGGSSLRRLLALEPMFNNSSLSIRREAVMPWIPQLEQVEGGEDGFLFYCALAAGGTVRATTDRLTRITIHGRATTATPVGLGTYNDRLVQYREFVRRNVCRLALCRDLVNASQSGVGAALLTKEVEHWGVLQRVAGGAGPDASTSIISREMMRTDLTPAGGTDILVRVMAVASAIAPRLTCAVWMTWRMAW
jgi:hypothetical protein